MKKRDVDPFESGRFGSELLLAFLMPAEVIQNIIVLAKTYRFFSL